LVHFSQQHFATCSCPSITIQLSKNKIAWLGITAKHQKAPLNIFRAQRWFLISGRCTLLKCHRASRTYALLKLFEVLVAQEDSLNTRFSESFDSSTGSRQLCPSNRPTNYDDIFGSEDSAEASRPAFLSGS
jgi:hypothetical protein